MPVREAFTHLATASTRMDVSGCFYELCWPLSPSSFVSRRLFALYNHPHLRRIYTIRSSLLANACTNHTRAILHSRLSHNLRTHTLYPTVFTVLDAQYSRICTYILICLLQVRAALAPMRPLLISLNLSNRPLLRSALHFLLLKHFGLASYSSGAASTRLDTLFITWLRHILPT